VDPVCIKFSLEYRLCADFRSFSYHCVKIQYMYIHDEKLFSD